MTALVFSAAVAFGAGNGAADQDGSGFLSRSAHAAPSLSGTVVNVSLTDAGGSMMSRRGAMMGQAAGMMSGGPMSLSSDQATVVHGTVSFLVTNDGGIKHEMVILPLPDSQAVGTRPIGADARIDEAGNLGEASNSNGKDAGEGVAPGASSWTTVTLRPGQYELVCNLPGHYRAGMYTRLTVT
ncbi:MAG: sulfocyanin-like copper-binding protein [Dermatophilaceae bacterium]